MPFVLEGEEPRVSTYLAGDAAVRLIPNSANFHHKARADLKAGPELKHQVTLFADAKGFRAQARERLALVPEIKHKIKLEADITGFRQAAQAKIDATGRLTAKVHLTIDKTSMSPAINQMKAELAAANLKVKIKVEIDDNGYRLKLLMLTRPISQTIRLDVDSAEIAALRAALSGITIGIGGVANGARSAGRAAGNMGGMFRVALVAVVALAAVSLVPLIGQLAQAAGVLALLPAMALSAGAVIATLGIGISGLSKAFTAKAPKTAAESANQLATAQSRIASSERGLRRAQEDSLRAQAKLNEERRLAVRRLRDMNDELDMSQWDEEGAAIAILRAQESLQRAYSEGTALDQREARNELNRTNESYDQIIKKNQDLRNDVDAANKAGIEGDSNVVDAKRGVQDALEGVVDAQETVTEAYDKGAAAASGQAGAVDELAEAMAKLSPNQKDFVEKTKSLGDEWTKLRMAVGDNLFQDLGDEMLNLGETKLPFLEDKLGGIATEINLGLKRALVDVNDESSRLDWTTIMDNTKASIGPLIDGLSSLWQALQNIAAVGSTFLPGIAGDFADTMQRFEEWTGSQEGQEEIRSFISESMKTLGDVWEFAKSLKNVIAGLFSTSDETGEGMLQGMTDSLNAFANWMKTAEGEQKMKAFWDDVRQGITDIMDMIKGAVVLVDKMTTLGRDLGIITNDSDRVAVSAKDNKYGGGEVTMTREDALKGDRYKDALGRDVTYEGRPLVGQGDWYPGIYADSPGAAALYPGEAAAIARQNAEMNDPTRSQNFPMVRFTPNGAPMVGASPTTGASPISPFGWDGVPKPGTKPAVGAKPWDWAFGDDDPQKSNRPPSVFLPNRGGTGGGSGIGQIGGRSVTRGGARTGGMLEGVNGGLNPADPFPPVPEDYKNPGEWGIFSQLADLGKAFAGIKESSDTNIKNGAETNWTQFTGGVASTILGLTTGDFPTLKTGLSDVGKSILGTTEEGGINWGNLGSKVGEVSLNLVGSIFPGLKTGLSEVGEFALGVVEGFGGNWDRLKNMAAEPINWIIREVINGALKNAWNTVAKVLGLDNWDGVAEIDVSGGDQQRTSRGGGGTFWKGGVTGVMPGYTPGRDPLVIGVSGGEAVMRPEWQRAVGPDHINQMNDIARRDGVGGVRAALAGQYASGGIVQAGAYLTSPIQESMWDAVRTAFPNAELTSGTRTEDVGSGFDNHMGQRAIDLGGPMDQIARWIYQMNQTQPVLELIHAPLNGWENLKNGAPLNYGPGTDADHYDHVHWAMDGMVDSDGKLISSDGGGFWNGVKRLVGAGTNAVQNAAANTFQMAVDTLGKAIPDFGPSLMGQIPKAAYEALTSGMIAKVRGSVDGGGRPGAASTLPPGTGPVVDQVRQVMAQYGWDSGPQWDALDQLISHESGWDPTIRNPSSGAFGLFQFLGATKDAYLPDENPNPGIQAQAGARYIKDRHQDPIGAWSFWQNPQPNPYGGNWYDDGGIANGTGLMAKNVLEPERVLSPVQTRAFEMLVPLFQQVLGFQQGGNPIAVEVVGIGKLPNGQALPVDTGEVNGQPLQGATFGPNGEYIPAETPDYTGNLTDLAKPPPLFSTTTEGKYASSIATSLGFGKQVEKLKSKEQAASDLGSSIQAAMMAAAGGPEAYAAHAATTTAAGFDKITKNFADYIPEASGGMLESALSMVGGAMAGATVNTGLSADRVLGVVQDAQNRQARRANPRRTRR